MSNILTITIALSTTVGLLVYSSSAIVIATIICTCRKYKDKLQTFKIPKLPKLTKFPKLPKFTKIRNFTKQFEKSTPDNIDTYVSTNVTNNCMNVTDCAMISAIKLLSNETIISRINTYLHINQEFTLGLKNCANILNKSEIEENDIKVITDFVNKFKNEVNQENPFNSFIELFFQKLLTEKLFTNNFNNSFVFVKIK